MKLTKKHIGQLFDNYGDGSWMYQLVDVNKKGHLLFWSFTCDGFVIDDHTDWQPFVPNVNLWSEKQIKEGWKHPKYGLKN